MPLQNLLQDYFLANKYYIIFLSIFLKKFPFKSFRIKYKNFLLIIFAIIDIILLFFMQICILKMKYRFAKSWKHIRDRIKIAWVMWIDKLKLGLKYE